MKKQAMYYEKMGNRIHCYLCPHNCIIDDKEYGRCGVRVNQDGRLISVNYGQVTSLSIDPIEKKPLKFYRPGRWILSAGSFGCNFTCGFCQNHVISQSRPPSDYVSRESMVRAIIKNEESIGIAFTYNEPSIWFEYVYECSILLKNKKPDSSVVLVTNGYINEEPLGDLLPYVDAMNIDLKSINPDYYQRICGGSLDPVLKTIERAAACCHVEVTTLLVSGENDRLDEVEGIAEYLGSIDKDIPLHLTRYFPRYKFSNPATDMVFMLKSKGIAERHLNRVVIGNI